MFKIYMIYRKRYARSPLEVKYYKQSSTVLLFKQLGWLPINKRINYFKLLQMHNVIHGSALTYLKDLFKTVDEIHNYNTRSNLTNEVCIDHWSEII